MPNRSNDELYQLIQTLEKAEKRNFKLFVTRNSSDGDLKIIQLFDLMDKMEEYDEVLLLKKGQALKKQQLPNLKAHLFRQILASLRILKDEHNIEGQLHQNLEYAKILYDKGLYQQSLKLLERIKETCKYYFQNTFLLQTLIFEKKIESLHITRSIHNRAEALTGEVDQVSQRLQRINYLSNLSLLLYSWYIHMGHSRNHRDLEAIREYFTSRIPQSGVKGQGFFELLYQYQCFTWYAFIRQDFLQYYRYTQKWVDLYDEYPQMRKVELMLYIKGLHNLLQANFLLRDYYRFNKNLERFEAFAASEEGQAYINIRAQTFVYLNIARINKHFYEGSFSEGLTLIPTIEAGLKTYEVQIDQHRILIFYYRIACLHFGCGDNNNAIVWLNKIIHWNVGLRSDIQCYARLLHLIAHFELGHFDLLEHLIKSVYRFLAKMDNLSVVEEEMFKFLRKSFQLNSPARIKNAFQALRDKLVKYEHNALETRTFMYLDIISWLESKVAGVPVQEIIQQKFHQSERRGPKGVV